MRSINYTVKESWTIRISIWHCHRTIFSLQVLAGGLLHQQMVKSEKMDLNIKKLLGSDAIMDFKWSVIQTGYVILECGTITLYLVVKVKIFN